MFDMPQIIFPAYKLLGYALTPLIPLYLKTRIRQGKEEAARITERYGHPSKPHPKGPLIWFHAASVGELTSALSLIDKINSENPDIIVLVTSGTVTSAEIAGTRLPPRAIHQFAALDSPIFINRFLDHWKPDLVVWLESEFWPNHLRAIKARKIPALLLNARLSQKSFDRWRKTPKSIQNLLSCFITLSAQSDKDRDRLIKLTKAGGVLREVLLPGNMKLAAKPLAYDQQEYKALRKVMGRRKIIVAASTHPGEEARLLACHEEYSRAIEQKPLLIIVPRHPDRGVEIAQLVRLQNGMVSQRSKKQPVSFDTDFYVADTLGELGLFYALADIVIMGGSLSGATGGHNPVEPALLNCAIVTGPDMSNFSSIIRSMRENEALKQCQNDHAVAKEIAGLLKDSNQATLLGENACKWAHGQSKSILIRVKKIIISHLPESKAG